MTRTTRFRAPPRLARAAMLAAAGALLLSPFVLTAPASAHDVFTGSTPSAGSTVTSVPTSVTLHFEEPPLAAGLAVAVTAPDHSLVTGANPTLAGTDVVAPVAPLTVSGVYTVAWRVVADDGHPVTGTFTFTVDLGSAAPSASATIPSSASLAATATPDGSSSSVPVGWIVACAGAVALAAVVVVAVSRRRLT